jgi:hypothetical protein
MAQTEYKEQTLREAIAEKDQVKRELYAACYGKDDTTMEDIDRLSARWNELEHVIARLHREVHGTEYSIWSFLYGVDGTKFVM